MDNELKKEIINCSRCALCMEVCPVYKVKKTETSVLRGKFLQILGLIRGDLKFDKNIKYNLDLCLGCKKCKRLYILVNSRHKYAPRGALAALLSHEALHQDEYNSLA